MVGEVATGVPLPSIPLVPLTTIPYLALGAAGLVFLAVGESVGAGRAYAARSHYEMPGPHATYADLTRYPDAKPVPRLVIVRLDAPLYSFNANVAKAQIEELVAARQPEPRGVLLDMAATADLDVTTADMLAGLLQDLHARSIEVLLAQVKGPVRDRLRRTGVMAELGEDRVYLSIGSAVTDFQRRWPPEEEAEPAAGTEPDADADAEADAEAGTAAGLASEPGAGPRSG